MKANTRLSINKISKTNEKYESRKFPQYVVKIPEFYCPISPEVPWYKGLVYKDCPVTEEQRDMGHCAECHLRGKDTFKYIKKADKKKKRSYKKRK